MKNIKFILSVIIAAILIPPFQWLVDSLVVIVVLCSFVFLILGLKYKGQINLKIPKLCTLYIYIFLVINFVVTKYVLLSARHLNIETICEFSLMQRIILLVLKFMGCLFFECILLFIIGQRVKRFAEIAARFALDSMPAKFLNIDFRLNSGEITEENATIRRNEIRDEVDYYSSMNGLANLIFRSFVVSFVLWLISIIGSVIVLHYENKFTLATFGQIVNYSVIEGMIFALMLSITIFGLCMSYSNPKDKIEMKEE